MNQSAIDSLQNGLASAVSTQWFKDQHLIFPRLIVISINVPIIIVALQVGCLGRVMPRVLPTATACRYLDVLSTTRTQP